jgi:lipid A 3-O-deacylase
MNSSDRKTVTHRARRGTRRETLNFSKLAALGVLLLIGCVPAFPEAQSRGWDFGVFAAAATGEENTNIFSEAQILGGGVFLGKALTGEMGRGWRRGQLEFGADFLPVFVQLAPQRIYGVGLDPMVLRWNSSLHRGRVTPFVELAGGGLHTSQNLPAGDTSNFNFIARAGGGLQVATGHAQAFEIACRWWHISNANLGTRNPEFNGIQVSLGWHWFK